MFDMRLSDAMICMQGSSDGKFEETERRKMKCLANSIFFSGSGGINNKPNLSLLTALLSDRVNLPSKADMHVYIVVHIPAGGN